jgi:recombination protein RecA
VKNKMSAPFKEVEFDILYGEGISKEGDLLDLAANYNVIEKSGTWYSYKDERIGQGRDASRNYLKDRPEMLAKIREEVLKKAGVVKAAAQAGAGATLAAPAAAEKHADKHEKTEKHSSADKHAAALEAAKAKAAASKGASAKK